MALVVGRYEGLFTLISPYNKGHTCIKEQPEADRQWSKEKGITTTYDCKTLHRKQRLSNTNLTTIRRLTQVHRKGEQLLHQHANGKPIKKLTFMTVSTQTEKNYMTTFRFTYLL